MAAYSLSAMIHVTVLAWLHTSSAVDLPDMQPTDAGRAMVEFAASMPQEVHESAEVEVKIDPVEVTPEAPSPIVVEVETLVEREAPSESPLAADPLPPPPLPELAIPRNAARRKQSESTSMPTPEVPRPLHPEKLPEAVASVASSFIPSRVGTDVDQVPRSLPVNVPPAYPSEAIQAGQEGRVVVRICVASDGTVSWARLETSSGYALLDQSALAAVQHWRFTPARRAGVAVEFEVLAPFPFSIRRR